VMAIMQKVPEGTPFGWDYDYGKVSTKVSHSPIWSIRNSGEAVATPKGVSVRLGFACDKINLDIYDIAGKLVQTKAVENFQNGTAMFLPMDMKALPPGYFVGCVRCFTNGKRSNPLFFPLNRFR
jgi:hypothetical protein